MVRRGLLDLLDSDQATATLITAGAGFGKSTLMSSWAAMVDHLSGALCDHVLGRSGSQRHIDELVASGNAFVVPIGSTGVYAYHPLFAEFLLDRLRVESTKIEAELRTRAIEWHTERSDWASATELALTGRNCVPVSPLLFNNVVPRIAAGEIDTPGRWLEHFDPGEVRSDALLSIVAAWHSVFTNRPGDVIRWLDAAT